MIQYHNPKSKRTNNSIIISHTCKTWSKKQTIAPFSPTNRSNKKNAQLYTRDEYENTVSGFQLYGNQLNKLHALNKYISIILAWERDGLRVVTSVPAVRILEVDEILRVTDQLVVILCTVIHHPEILLVVDHVVKVLPWVIGWH